MNRNIFYTYSKSYSGLDGSYFLKCEEDYHLGGLEEQRHRVIILEVESKTLMTEERIWWKKDGK